MTKFTTRLAGLCLVLSALFTANTGHSQTTYTIPGSGLQSAAYGPVDICHAKYTAEADIFPSSSLTYGTVTKVAYDQIQGSASNVPIKIYMMNNSAGTFSAAASWSSTLSGATLVYSGNVSFSSAGWNTITLSTPFTYSSGNLEVLVETDWGTTTVCTGNPEFYYYTSSGNTDQFWEGSASSSSALQSETGVLGDQPAPIQLTITACTNPTITAQPSTSTQSICQSGTASAVSVTATGTALTYQWYKNATSSNSGGTAISGATSASYTPSTTTTGTLYYYCIVNSNGCTSTTNVSGAIVINTIPTLNSQSTNGQTLCQGSTASAMSVSASGTALTYQWYSNTTSSNTGGTIISSATSSSYTPSSSATGTLYYYCTISSNGGCPVTSAVSGAIVVNGTAAPTGTTPQLFCSSVNPTIASLSATGTSIYWYTSASEGTPLASSIPLTSGIYYASQTVSGCQSVSTLAVTVTVNGAPTIVSQSTGPQSVCRDSFALAMNINATGTSLTYQWYKDSVAANSGGTLIAGATSSNYTPSTIKTGTWYYYCVVSGIAPCTQAVSAVSGAIVTYLCNINGLPAGGDLSGYYPNPTVAKINGMTVPTSSTGYLYNNGSGTLAWSLAGTWNQSGTSINYTNGNVGIGTTSPNYPLEVDGDAAVTGNLYGQNIYASNKLSAGNFRFVNGVVDSASDSIVSNAPILQLSANKVSLANNLNVTVNSVAMPGIATDTVSDSASNANALLMTMDRKGNLKPATTATIQSILFTPPGPLNSNPCIIGSSYPLPKTWLSTYNGSILYTYPCQKVGVGTSGPDASFSIFSTNLNALSVTNGTNDFFTIDGVGNTNMSGSATVGGTLTTNGAIPTPNGYLMASFNNGSNKIILTSHNQAADFNQITQAGDAGIFWTDNGTNNNSSGFVIGPWAGSNMGSTGIRIDASGNLNTTGQYYQNGNPLGVWNTTTNASNATVLWFGGLNNGQQVGIGTSTPDPNAILDVNGIERALEIRVCPDQTCDYVFDKDYSVMSLDTLKAYLKLYHHLPEIASAEQMKTEGTISLGKMDMQLLKKIEELTLYTITQDEKEKQQEERNNKQEKEIKELEAKLDMLIKSNQK